MPPCFVLQTQNSDYMYGSETTPCFGVPTNDMDLIHLAGSPLRGRVHRMVTEPRRCTPVVLSNIGVGEDKRGAMCLAQPFVSVHVTYTIDRDSSNKTRCLVGRHDESSTMPRIPGRCEI